MFVKNINYKHMVLFGLSFIILNIFFYIIVLTTNHISTKPDNSIIPTSKKFKSNISDVLDAGRINYAIKNNVKSLKEFFIDKNSNVFKEKISYYEEYTKNGSINKTIEYRNGQYFNKAEYFYDTYDNLLATKSYYENILLSDNKYIYFNDKIIKQSQDRDTFDETIMSSTSEKIYNEKGFFSGSTTYAKGRPTYKSNCYYNNRNKLTNIKTWFKCTCIHGSSGEVKFEYDINDNLINKTTLSYHGPVQTDEIEVYKYDINNNLIEKVKDENDHLCLYINRYEYDNLKRFRKSYCSSVYKNQPHEIHQEFITYYVYDDICYYDFDKNINSNANIIIKRIEYEYY